MDSRAAPAPARAKRPRKRVRRFLLAHVLPPFVYWLYRAWGATWRYSVLHRERYESVRDAGRPLVVGFFHQRNFSLLHFNARPEHGSKWVLMASRSRDGELMSRVVRRIGYRTVRGSSGEGGGRALVSMIQLLRKEPGWSASLAVDGSRGPLGVVQAGLLTLAQKTGAWILPVAASPERALVYHRSWDHSVLPLPFARVWIAFGEPLEVPADADGEELEARRAELERRLHALHAEADGRSGFAGRAPLR